MSIDYTKVRPGDFAMTKHEIVQVDLNDSVCPLRVMTRDGDDTMWLSAKEIHAVEKRSEVRVGDDALTNDGMHVHILHLNSNGWAAIEYSDGSIGGWKVENLTRA